MIIGLLMGATAMQADDEKDASFIFTDEDGNEIADGSVIYATEAEETPTGVEINSGLYIKNALDAVCWVNIEYTVSQLPSGYHQICTQTLCNTDTEAGDYSYPSTITLKAGVSADMFAEWVPDSYGTCAVSYTLKTMNYEGRVDGVYQYSEVGEGPTVTVYYVYADPASIKTISNQKVVSTTYYGLSGRKISKPTKGVYIAKQVLADGTTKTFKVTMK